MAWEGFPCANPLCPPTPFRNLWKLRPLSRQQQVRLTIGHPGSLPYIVYKSTLLGSGSRREIEGNHKIWLKKLAQTRRDQESFIETHFSHGVSSCPARKGQCKRGQAGKTNEWSLVLFLVHIHTTNLCSLQSQEEVKLPPPLLPLTHSAKTSRV